VSAEESETILYRDKEGRRQEAMVLSIKEETHAGMREERGFY